MKNFGLLKHKNNIKANPECEKTFVIYKHNQQKTHIHNIQRTLTNHYGKHRKFNSTLGKRFVKAMKTYMRESCSP